MITLRLREATSSRPDYDLFEGMYKVFRYAEIDDKTIPRTSGTLTTFEAYLEYITNKGNILFIQEDGTDKVIGYFIMSWYEDGGARVNEMYITEDNQRKGYGKKAVKALIALVKEEGFKWVELMSYSIATDNFWSACNFRYTGSNDEYKFHIK